MHSSFAASHATRPSSTDEETLSAAIRRIKACSWCAPHLQDILRKHNSPLVRDMRAFVILQASIVALALSFIGPASAMPAQSERDGVLTCPHTERKG
jgi:hypothetical protein